MSSLGCFPVLPLLSVSQSTFQILLKRSALGTSHSSFLILSSPTVSFLLYTVSHGFKPFFLVGGRGEGGDILSCLLSPHIPDRSYRNRCAFSSLSISSSFLEISLWFSFEELPLSDHVAYECIIASHGIIPSCGHMTSADQSALSLPAAWRNWVRIRPD